MKLREIAHSRAGDKGETLNISVIAYDPRDYPILERCVTAERVRTHFGDLVAAAVIRYEVPSIAALNFVLRRVPSGGVTRSLALDSHGKSLSSAMLDLDVERVGKHPIEEAPRDGDDR